MKNKKFFDVMKELGPYIAVIVIVLLVKSFLVSPIRVQGDSMDTTLRNGDIMILDEISYRFKDIKRFDIVVIKIKGEYLIKRIVGLPGEKVKYKNGKLFINNSYVKEKFSHSETEDFEEVKLKKDEYFVLGDNRVVSMDSRYFGPFNKKEIKGHTKLTLLPFSRLGIKK